MRSKSSLIATNQRSACSNQLHSRRRTSQSLRGRNNKRCSQKAPQQLIMKYIAFFIFLSLIVISGCSVLQNSERFYRDHPRGPINPKKISWRAAQPDLAERGERE